MRRSSVPLDLMVLRTFGFEVAGGGTRSLGVNLGEGGCWPF